MTEPPRRHSASVRLRNRFVSATEEFRSQLAYIDALPQLTLLGLASGILAALIIVIFRLIIDSSLGLMLNGQPDDFESLSPGWRFFLPFAGALIIGCCLYFIKPVDRSVSVSHVLDRLHHHQGRLPFKNLAVQFLGGIASLVSGQSVGREGPAVHLGAGAASLMGHWLTLPHNSLRTLVGCGVAAAIAASFNTPMAGVIFAMEVVLMEYTITGFIPVILASVSGAIIGQLVFTQSAGFSVQTPAIDSLREMPMMAISGLVVALVAVLFLRLQSWLSQARHYPVILRMGFIGTVTGLIALVVPQVMGMGYDTLELAMFGELGLNLLITIVIAKLAVSALCAALGMPGGVIGPVLVIGGCLGGILGYVSEIFYPSGVTAAGFYVTLGMVAMMGAVLNAPLAAMLAVLELTYNPNIIFPSMVVIVVANVISQQVFKMEGIFVAQLRQAGTPLGWEPGRQILSRAGVRSLMSTKFKICARVISLAEVRRLLSGYPRWILIDEEDAGIQVLHAADLGKFIDSPPDDYPELQQAGQKNAVASDKNAKADGKNAVAGNKNAQASGKKEPAQIDIDLLDIPGQRFAATGLNQRANLYEARQALKKTNSDVVYIERPGISRRTRILGIITREMIDNYYST